MKVWKKSGLLILSCWVIGLVFIPASKLIAAGKADHTALVIVLDGLRPDYVTSDLMPHLHSLGEKGVVYENHHAVFPTVTRVNSPSIATGTYPAGHGLMGNSVYFPEISDVELSTSSHENLRKIESETGGNLLTISAAGEVYEKAGKKVLAVSSGSGGSAFLLNHKGRGGGVIAVEVIHPAAMEAHVLDVLGPVPENDAPSIPRNTWAVNAYLEIGLKEVKPDLTLMWLTDPDHTAHEFGIGAPEMVRSLKEVDILVGRILRRHQELGMEDRVNILVTSDHGFSTRESRVNLGQLLKEHHLNQGLVEVSGSAIYLKPYEEDRLSSIVRMLQAEPTVGAIFTRARNKGELRGRLPGTFSFKSIHWDHKRAADILVSPSWTDNKNEFGYRGFTAWGSVAGHGSSSPFDIHNTLILSGPDIKKSRRIKVPSGNVDILPTVCFLQGVELADKRDGRVLKEALSGGPDPDAIEVETRSNSAEAPGYHLELNESIVEGKRYLNFTRTTRE
jgi:arylsulfatase A-like enzyme